jgi:hypothetical protein
MAIILGDNVAGSPFPGTLHTVGTWLIGGLEYEKTGPLPPPVAGVTIAAVTVGLVTTYTATYGGGTLATLTITVDGSGNFVSAVGS